MFGAFFKVVGFFMDLIEVFVVSMSIFVVVYLFLMQPHQVKGSSMYPTFEDGEYLMTDKITYRTRNPVYGDVVVFKAPMAEAFDFIKRVIAVPGDTVTVQNGWVYLNGQLLEEPYLSPEYRTRGGRYIRDGIPLTVPDGHYVVFGDNRDHSSDSREWGPVPLENFVGRAFFRYWPPNKAGIIANPEISSGPDLGWGWRLGSDILAGLGLRSDPDRL